MTILMKYPILHNIDQIMHQVENMRKNKMKIVHDEEIKIEIDMSHTESYNNHEVRFFFSGTISKLID